MTANTIPITTGRSAQSGFTFIELITLMAFMAIIGTLGVPQLAAISKSFDRFNSRNHLLEDLKRAQAESITEGCRGIINVVDGGTRYEYGCDYLGYDVSSDPVSDRVKFARDMPSHITIATTGPIIFDSRGQAVDSAGIINNVTLRLNEGGIQFANGTLLGTGVFKYE